MFIKELTDAECHLFLSEQRFGRISCALENQPYTVPFHFAFDGEDYLYVFATFGQKIEWMRANPLVCVEVDDIQNQFEWFSLVIFGSYEELPDSPEFAEDRAAAYALLSRHAMWWQPGFVIGSHPKMPMDEKPIFFRVHIDQITGRQAFPEDLPFGENLGMTLPKPG